LHLPATAIDDLVHERRGLDPAIARRLAAHFGGDAESRLALQATYQARARET
jgi:plasmid maintenance system antidote protein VapI